MLNWTEADRPYVEALVALETVSRVLLLGELRSETYAGPTVWGGLAGVGTSIRMAWTGNRLARLRANMAMRRA